MAGAFCNRGNCCRPSVSNVMSATVADFDEMFVLWSG